MPAAVLQREFLSEGCHKPKLPLKDAGRGALPSQREVKNQMAWQVLLYRGPESVCLVQLDITSGASLMSHLQRRWLK